MKETSMFENLREDTKILFLIIGLGLIIRVFYVLTMTPNTIIFPDGIQYEKIAKNLLKGEGFSIGTDSYPYQHNRAPAYPSFIALIYLFFGRDFVWVKIAQTLLNVLTILPIYGLGMMIFDKRVALTASFIMAIDPFIIFFTGLILSEILFMAFLSSSLFFLYVGIKNNKYLFLSVGSFMMGAAILTRASLLLFPVFILTWILLEKRKDMKEALSFCTLFIMILFLTLLPWSLRNYFIYHSIVPVTIGSGLSLYEANNPLADGGPGVERLPPVPISLSSIERDRFYRDKAIQFISENPAKFLRLALAKFKRFWNIIPNYKEYRSKGFIFISILFYGPILVFGIIGIILSLTRDKKVLFLLLPVIYYTGLHMIFIGSVRYRVPIMPFFIIISAYGFIEIVCLLPFKKMFNSLQGEA